MPKPTALAKKTGPRAGRGAFQAAGERRREIFPPACRRNSVFLDMPNVRFEAQQTTGELGPTGADQLQFLVSTNPGEPPKPMAKIASGGELSRIMLALKTVLADRDVVGSMIFDEVDAGVGGSAANKVGRKLKQVSRAAARLSVSHIPRRSPPWRTRISRSRRRFPAGGHTPPCGSFRRTRGRLRWPA